MAKQTDRFTVTGPDIEPPRKAGSVGQAVSIAQNFACRHEGVGTWRIHEYEDEVYTVRRERDGVVITQEAGR